ncbi:MAG: hypothetical protein HFJ49_02575 [Clostridia bacterium]|nr:hypothetical protein [Clostridia bacterium]
MFKQLAKMYKVWRLSNLTPKHVKYEKDKSLIRVTKATVSLVVRCEFCSDNPEGEEPFYVVRLSGDPLILENDIVEAIITALWHTTAGLDQQQREVTFSEVSVRVDPTFFKISKVEVIPLRRSIYF